MRIKLLDGAALGIALVVLVFVSVSIYGGAASAKSVVVEASGTSWVYPLSKNATYEAPGPLGNTTIVVEDETVRVTDSPCKNKLCILQGRISNVGQWIACLPNRVFVRIDGKPVSGGVDAAVR